MGYLTPIEWSNCTALEKKSLLTRPRIISSGNIKKTVSNILNQVKIKGDKAIHEFTIKFDNISLKNFRVTSQQIQEANRRINNKLKQAIDIAANNIRTFHTAQIPNIVDIETQPGVRCQQINRPIKSIGLYIPAGSAPLFSTVLMLAIPARIAGCSEIVLCSPPPIADEILYTADLFKITEIFQLGGSQAIGALAFGTATIPPVDKIFGPGNIYVTEAKKQVNQRQNGVAIDMPAGPSELLIIADEKAIPEFIASDLLSQAEHGLNSQVILLTTSLKLAQKVSANIKKQLTTLERQNIIITALNNSLIIVLPDINQCIKVSNIYGPEHLMIQTSKPKDILQFITNAGSIFLGPWSPESAGDYASGTNHVLPTYGYTKTFSGISVIDFQKRITVQELTPKGLLNLSSTIEILSEAEKLEAHKRAVAIRVALLKEAI
ncbi:histidinol dehydrogenase [Candidatus Pantoea edessiphila]|uniref:Histidinol dehydrogenase n=1 Tax=Candidatus Pantoea edessiphila TaxID=2044610 RepID=A0A2P5SYQ3_9GAMM|nr:histidinol dehydrogenase [Candidatus Pantoea edessiphila]MBK4775453.1 histidinol dehydrogenase [Pantoea sp. Edef]PPI87420.1 histidinol dehydrogenase [Candidatus Pantoea edessiphila]